MALVPVQLKRLQLDRSLRPTAMSTFRAILPDKAVLDYCKQSGVEFRDRMYTPLLTFWAFVAQCLDPDHSCRKAVSYVLSWRRSGKAPRQRRNRKRGNVGSGNSGRLDSGNSVRFTDANSGSDEAYSSNLLEHRIGGLECGDRQAEERVDRDSARSRSDSSEDCPDDRSVRAVCAQGASRKRGQRHD